MIVVGLVPHRCSATRRSPRAPSYARARPSRSRQAGVHPAAAARVLERMLAPSPVSRRSPTACRRSAAQDPERAEDPRRSWAASPSCCSSGLTALALISRRALRREPLRPDRLRRLRDGTPQRSLIAQIAAATFGNNSILFFIIQAATALRAAARGQHRVQRLPAARLGARAATATRPSR